MGSYLVTGACGGMGRAICKALEGAGHRVWGMDRDVSGGPERCFQADITDPGALEAVAGLLRQEAGTLDGVIHAAGIYDLDSLVEITEERMKRIFDVNLLGMMRVNRIFLPLLAEGGRIVIISSELAPLRPLPFTGIYAVTKGAVEKYAYALRMELQLLNHPVTVIRPGAVKTGMLPASTACLDRFCENTRLYRCNAERFRDVVRKVETRNVPPEKVAKAAGKAVSARRPPLVIPVNRSPLLILFNLLPSRLQLALIRMVISGKKA